MTIAEAPNPSISVVIAENASKYGVSEKTIRAVINCESGFDEDAVGDHGKSFGLVQIHLPAHPSITKEMANDREFAVEFLAKNLSTGNGKIWTCYRILKEL